MGGLADMDELDADLDMDEDELDLADYVDTAQRRENMLAGGPVAYRPSPGAQSPDGIDSSQIESSLGSVDGSPDAKRVKLEQ